MKSESFRWKGAEQILERVPRREQETEEKSAEMRQKSSVRGRERLKGGRSGEEGESDLERLCKALAQSRGVSTLTRAVENGWGRGGWTENTGIK